jgi:hypothetical protein
MLPKDRLLRLLSINALLGALLGFGFVAGLIILDTAGLRRMILADRDGIYAVALLAGGFIVTCSSVLMGSAVMRAGSRPDDGPRTAGGASVPVALTARRR